MSFSIMSFSKKLFQSLSLVMGLLVAFVGVINSNIEVKATEGSLIITDSTNKTNAFDIEMIENVYCIGEMPYLSEMALSVGDYSMRVIDRSLLTGTEEEICQAFPDNGMANYPVILVSSFTIEADSVTTIDIVGDIMPNGSWYIDNTGPIGSPGENPNNVTGFIYSPVLENVETLPGEIVCIDGQISISEDGVHILEPGTYNIGYPNYPALTCDNIVTNSVTIPQDTLLYLGGGMVINEGYTVTNIFPTVSITQMQDDLVNEEQETPTLTTVRTGGSDF